MDNVRKTFIRMMFRAQEEAQTGLLQDEAKVPGWNKGTPPGRRMRARQDDWRARTLKENRQEGENVRKTAGKSFQGRAGSVEVAG
ncbi:MAG: hypothetical protein E6X23_06460 [Mixta calida]|uniref:hypothetical protein n=1 Tax=Mixta calida TaxID=665913 RepID=UPI0029078B3B|nr:hypothetical protein [Mixta calida]MDU4941164.1 hypothetical protein [Mixta calida]